MISKSSKTETFGEPIVDGPVPLGRRVVAELLGTFLLATIAFGAGLQGEKLAPGLGAFAGGLTLAALVLSLGGVSGGHFNPAVSIAILFNDRGDAKGFTKVDFGCYVLAQLVGAFAGVSTALATFGEPFGVPAAGDLSIGSIFGEALASGSLILVVLLLVRSGKANLIPAGVALVLTVAGLGLASSAMNPAITLAKIIAGAGIPPVTAAVFAVTQLVAAVLAAAVAAALTPQSGERPRLDRLAADVGRAR